MKALKTIFTLAMLLAGLVFSACSGDGDDNAQPGIPDQKPLTEIEKMIIGGWPELGPDGVTFLKDGIVVYDKKMGHWQYNKVTQTLTTDITDEKGNVLIWQINMLKEGSMVGIQVWNGKTFAAKRNARQALKDILTCRSWTRDQRGRLLVIDFEIDRYDNRREYIYYTYEKYDESKTLVSLDDDDVVVSEDDYATITVKWTDDSPWWHGDAIIYNPYDLKDVRFQFPKGLVYYPVTDGMPEMEKADMSKREALLVGKWICQEQVYTDPQDPKRDHRDIYMDDEYGMEFTPDYWYTLWAGDDELLEWGGHNDSWWIKDTLLCSNSLNDWGDDFSIVSLTEKEMVLRTWYADGDFVTAKFYKYNEEEGLLGDRLEYVDLGLSVKWATRNLGAEDKDAPIAGKYYAWGETQAKSEYTPENYKFYKKQGTQNWSWYKLTKYCSDPHGGYEGFVDNKMTLDTEDDAARAIRGKEWRMPTPEEMEELVSNCTWSWTRQEGVGGYKVTGKTGYYIFLPAARYTGNDNWRECGYYLTNSKMNDTEPGDYPMLKAFRFDSYSSPKVGKMYDIVFHHYGCSIRPVRP